MAVIRLWNVARKKPSEYKEFDRIRSSIFSIVFVSSHASMEYRNVLSRVGLNSAFSSSSKLLTRDEICDNRAVGMDDVVEVFGRILAVGELSTEANKETESAGILYREKLTRFLSYNM